MTERSCSFVFLPGAGGGEADLTVFRNRLGSAFHFEIVDYPGWQRYIDDSFSAEVLVAEIAEQISARVPQGPILLSGASLGGHFGYAAALRLQAMGREIAGFCAIDTFMIDSSGPSEGWQTRALAYGLELLRKGQFGKFTRFMRSRFWRALFRLASSRLTNLVRKSAPSGRLPIPLAVDPIAEEELSMRLLLRAVAPWVSSLDREPAALNVPVVLLRTPSTAGDDAAWRRRCPNIRIVEIPGQHLTLFAAENIGTLCDAFIAATSEWCRKSA
ncbi:MAG: alpha/beta fold hydrolase [Acidobacteriaceae bacterium]|jgi:thioesterase domain-containing protein